VLSCEGIRSFEADGFIKIEAGLDPDVADHCSALIWTELAKYGPLEDDPQTWTEPLVRFPCPDGGPFVVAGTAPQLTSAYDQLLGPSRWRNPEGVGGNVFARFPSDIDPLQTKWHIDGAYRTGNAWHNNVYCKGKGLLVLFLFSEVSVNDAPTLLLRGSHLDMATVLEPFGERGLSFEEICQRIPDSTLGREVVPATGYSGDVYVCHPLLVHSPSWHHQGRNPRLLAQPGIRLEAPFALVDHTAAAPVERAIMAALGRIPPESSVPA